MTKNCLTLIGMPASGKSSVGVVLAKKTGRRFVDGDLLIQEQNGKLLKELIAERGDDGFRALEEETLASLETENAVIAPGGSVIYGEKAMARLKALGRVIYLKLSYPAIRRRLGDLTARGVSIKEGQSLRDLYRERTVLYEKYADLVIDETGLSTRKVVDAILRAIGEGGDSVPPEAPKKAVRQRRKRNGKGSVARRQHAVSGAGRDGELPRKRRKQQSDHRRVGGDSLLRSADGVDLRSPGTSLSPSAGRERRVRNQSDHRGTGPKGR